MTLRIFRSGGERRVRERVSRSASRHAPAPDELGGGQPQLSMVLPSCFVILLPDIGRFDGQFDDYVTALAGA